MIAKRVCGCIVLLILAVSLFAGTAGADDSTAPYSIVETVIVDDNPSTTADEPETASPPSQDEMRQPATEQLPVPDNTLFLSILENLRFDSDLSGLVNVLETTQIPYKTVFGEALYYIILFGILIGLVWIGSGSVKIPAIIGLGLSGFAMTFLPNAWQTTILVLIAVIITTGIMFLWIRRQEAV